MAITVAAGSTTSHVNGLSAVDPSMSFDAGTAPTAAYFFLVTNDNNANDREVDSCTYNSVSATQILDNDLFATFTDHNIYRLASPSSGSNAVQATTVGNPPSLSAICSIAFDGIDTADPEDTPSSNIENSMCTPSIQYGATPSGSDTLFGTVLKTAGRHAISNYSGAQIYDGFDGVNIYEWSMVTASTDTVSWLLAHGLDACPSTTLSMAMVLNASSDNTTTQYFLSDLAGLAENQLRDGIFIR